MEKSQLAKQTGRKLTAAREEAGLSRTEVGQRLGLSERGYGHIEAGRSLITLDYLLQLPRILGKPITYFLPTHALTQAELNDLAHDPAFQQLQEAWLYLRDIGAEADLAIIHSLAVHTEKRYRAIREED